MTPVALQAAAAVAFALVFFGFLALATWAAVMAAMFAGLGHGSASFAELGLVFAVVGAVGLGVATVVAYGIRRADAIGGRLAAVFRSAKQRMAPEVEARELRCHLCGTLYPSVYYFADARAQRLACTQCAPRKTQATRGAG